MEVFSTAFDSGDKVPEKYTCGGEDVSPPLAWRDIPQGAKSLVLICDDPDSGDEPWSHWVIYNIPVEKTEIPEGIEKKGRLPWGALQGRNSFGNIGYGGPCPRLGETHRYFWRLYALEEECDLMPGATRAQLMDWMEDRIVGQSEIVGVYSQV